MQSLLDFAANKSCPELSQDTSSLSDSSTNLRSHDSTSEHIYGRASSFPLLSQEDFEASRDDLETESATHNMTTTTEDDVIEILSCHVEPEEDVPSGHALVSVKIPNGEGTVEDASNTHRRRVARAIGVVTFLLLLFSVILIGISLNMSKNIDEMVRQSTMSMRNPQPKFFRMMDNSTHLNHS